METLLNQGLTENSNNLDADFLAATAETAIALGILENTTNNNAEINQNNEDEADNAGEISSLISSMGANVPNEINGLNEAANQNTITNETTTAETTVETTEDKPKRKTKVKELVADNTVNFLSNEQEALLLKVLKNPMHKVASLIMLDAGLRISEVITLQVKNLDFKKKVLLVKSLKKRGLDSIRSIPLSTRLIENLAEYFKILKPTEHETYLFPGAKKGTHISRKAFNQLFDRLKFKYPDLINLHPHALRHTFATKNVIAGTAIHDVKSMLGHSSINTTLIYNHTPVNVLRANIEASISHNENPIKKWFKSLFKSKVNGPVINYVNSDVNFTIGRDKILKQLLSNINNNINTILYGPIGVGKTHILNQINASEKKVLLFDDLSNIKVSFSQMLLYLYKNDKDAVFQMMYGAFNLDEFKQKISKDTVSNIIAEIIQVTNKKEYVLMIDNVDSITPKGMKLIEQLKDHFTIITSTREIAINKTNFIWNFDRVKVENLTRTESLQLIVKLSFGQSMESPDIYRNHIYDQSQGNPRVIAEMVERYSKETFLTPEVIREYKHVGGLLEIDMSLWVVVILSFTAVLRFTKHEVGQDMYRFVGGCALIFAMLFRMFLSKTRRKVL